MSNAIFCLTRGYPGRQMMYGRLIERNTAIKNCIGTQWPLVIFHEGNISENDQQFIQKFTTDLKIRWVAVSLQFLNGPDVPEETIRTFYDGSCYPGYHCMCEFHMCDVWDHLKEFDKVLRIDEDCIINGAWIDIFDSVTDETPYSTPTFDVETHELTNKTIGEWCPEYDKSMPYTNVFIAKMSMWLREDIRNFTNEIKKNRGCIKFRWGDAPIHGLILKKFSVPYAIMKKYAYFHGSHNRMVN